MSKSSVLKAIKAKCLDCVCGVPSEVKLCPDERCPLHNYRFGKDPDSHKVLTDTQRAQALKNLGKSREKSDETDS